MVRGGQEQAGVRPLVNLLEDHSHQALQLTDIRLIAASLGDGIDLVEQQNGLMPLGVIHRSAQVVASLAEETAHDRCQIEHP